MGGFTAKADDDALRIAGNIELSEPGASNVLALPAVPYTEDVATARTTGRRTFFSRMGAPDEHRTVDAQQPRAAGNRSGRKFCS